VAVQVVHLPKANLKVARHRALEARVLPEIRVPEVRALPEVRVDEVIRPVPAL
jgi:hypothetical protein